MDRNKAIDLLEQELNEVPRLRELHHERDKQQFKLWLNKIRSVIEAALEPDDLRSFSSQQPVLMKDWFPDDSYQKNYLDRLTDYETALKSIIQKYETLGILEVSETTPEKSVTTAESPKAFIAHGGETKARNKLQKFLIALGVKPLIIEEEPQEGRSVNEQVEYYSKLADCAIVLGTADDKELKDGKLYPRRNDFIEIGRFLEKFPSRIIYLLEEGASFPSIIAEKLRTPFTHESMDDAFTAIVRELTAFGILKAVKP